MRPSSGDQNPWKMAQPAQLGSFHVSTEDLPECLRLEMFCDIVARSILRQQVETFADCRFRIDSDVRALPGLFVYWSTCSPLRIGRTPELVADGNDNLAFIWSSQARRVEHLGQDVAAGPGEAVLISCADASSTTFPAPFETVTINVPRKAFGHLLQDLGSCVARPVPSNSSALDLLLRYLAILRDGSAAPTPELQDAAVVHVYDLLSIVLGATREAAEEAKKRGLRAARLNVIKKSIRENLANGDFSVSDVAALHHLKSRSVQLLFEDEGTTFTEFIGAERLDRAYGMLASPRYQHHKIVEIALGCGFDDISYFNRKFRCRFGATPSDIRNRLPPTVRTKSTTARSHGSSTGST